MKPTPRNVILPVIVLLCALVPPMVTNRGWWFIGRTHGPHSEPFEVLGMLVSAALLFHVVAAWRTRGSQRLETVVRAVVTAAIVFSVLYNVVNHAGTSWDYRCYDKAAHNITTGANPYHDTAYLYPPLLAQCLAALNGFVESTTLFRPGDAGSWWIVFYFYQVLQLLLVFFVVELAFTYARRLKIPIVWAGALILILFVANAAFFRTLRFHQTNLIVLLAILYSMARLRERPLWCGVLMAIAVMVKPQGILFPVVWFAIGARRAALGFLVAAAVLVLVQSGFGADWTLWRQFIDSLSRVPQSNNFFRNQSLYSLLSTMLRTVGVDGDRSILLVVVRVCYVGVLGWFGFRFIDREKRFRAAVAQVARDARAHADRVARVGAHTVDIVMLALLCSPIVWEHHYTIAIPVVVWVVALAKGRVPTLALVGLVLMFVPSTFDVWFFSYHRIAGAVMLVVALSPARVIELYRERLQQSFPVLEDEVV